MKKIKYLIVPILIINLFLCFNYNVKADDNTNATYNTNTISCGSVQGIPEGIPKFSRNAINVLKVLVPIILIVLGMIDMLRAVTSNDEKSMKEATNRLIKRVIASVLIFFVIVLVQFIVKTVAKSTESSIDEDKNTENVKTTTNDITSCITCFISDGSYCKLDNYFGETGDTQYDNDYYDIDEIHKIEDDDRNVTGNTGKDPQKWSESDLENNNTQGGGSSSSF